MESRDPSATLYTANFVADMFTDTLKSLLTSHLISPANQEKLFSYNPETKVEGIRNNADAFCEDLHSILILPLFQKLEHLNATMTEFVYFDKKNNNLMEILDGYSLSLNIALLSLYLIGLHLASSYTAELSLPGLIEIIIGSHIVANKNIIDALAIWNDDFAKPLIECTTNIEDINLQSAKKINYAKKLLAFFSAFEEKWYKNDKGEEFLLTTPETIKKILHIEANHLKTINYQTDFSTRLKKDSKGLLQDNETVDILKLIFDLMRYEYLETLINLFNTNNSMDACELMKEAFIGKNPTVVKITPPVSDSKQEEMENTSSAKDNVDSIEFPNSDDEEEFSKTPTSINSSDTSIFNMVEDEQKDTNNKSESNIIYFDFSDEIKDIERKVKELMKMVHPTVESAPIPTDQRTTSPLQIPTGNEGATDEEESTVSESDHRDKPYYSDGNRGLLFNSNSWSDDPIRSNKANTPKPMRADTPKPKRQAPRAPVYTASHTDMPVSDDRDTQFNIDDLKPTPFQRK